MAHDAMVFLPVDGFFMLPLDEWAAAVATAVPTLSVTVAEAGVDPSPLLAKATSAFGMLTPELLAAAPNLRWLQAPAAAPPPSFFFPELIDHPVVVTNLRGVYRDNLANHIMAYVLSFAAAFLDTGLHRVGTTRWRRDLDDMGILDLGATTMLLIGVGEVGAATAAHARAFGIRVVGVDTFPDRVQADLDELHHFDDFDRLLPGADWVVLTVPHTPVTEGMMHSSRFEAMKSSAYFINVGRGETVRLDDLTSALENGSIAGAAIDVSEIEPLPSEHRLWRIPNVIVTPHVAGFGSDTDADRRAIIVENAQRFVRGEPLRYAIDKTLRY